MLTERARLAGSTVLHAMVEASMILPFVFPTPLPVMDIVTPEEIESFCGECERRTGPDRTCEDGPMIQQRRAFRGDCVNALVKGMYGLMMKNKTFTPIFKAKPKAVSAATE
jgi:hypothetical protein